MDPCPTLPQTPLGELTAPSHPGVDLRGPTSKGALRGGRGKRVGKVGEGRERVTGPLSQIPGSAPASGPVWS